MFHKLKHKKENVTSRASSKSRDRTHIKGKKRDIHKGLSQIRNQHIFQKAQKLKILKINEKIKAE